MKICKAVIFFYIVNNTIQDKIEEGGCLARDAGTENSLQAKNKKTLSGHRCRYRDISNHQNVPINVHNTPKCPNKYR